MWCSVQGALLQYAAWAALWDALRMTEARKAANTAAALGRVPTAAVWAHVLELTLLQVCT